MERFCENCEEISEYRVKMINKSYVIKGIRIEYVGKAAYCIECGKEMFVPEVRNYNLYALEKEYRKL